MDHKKNIRIARWIFGIYCAGMLWLLFWRAGRLTGLPYWEQFEMNLNLEPFRTIRLYVRLLLSRRNPHMIPHAIVNLAGNVLMFIPLGFLLPLCFPKLRTFSRTLGAACGIVTVIELLQLFTLLGSCDIDDLILNIPGAAIGYLFFTRLPGYK